MPESNKDFAIVGAGWLGEALAHALVAEGKKVTATSRTPEKIERMTSVGFETILYQLGDNVHKESLQRLFEANVLILNVAPGRMKQDIEHFIACMKGLIDRFMCPVCERNYQPHVVFISTTSVYGEQTRTVTEKSTVEPLTISARAHVELEQYIHAQYAGQATVLRLAGLVGADRHPVHHLVKKPSLASANKRVNLIDRVDVIAAIKAICNKNLWGETLHLCGHEHPSRKDYYSWAADRLGLLQPVFTDEKSEDIGKIIDSSATCEKLGLTLTYASPYDILS